MSKYLKLLTPEDIEEILKAADIELFYLRKDREGKIIAPFDKGKDFILCRATTKKNPHLALIIQYLTPLIGQATYASRDILVNISDFHANVFTITATDDEFDDEAVKMTLKLKDILSKKSSTYAEDFQKYWESDEDEDENE